MKNKETVLINGFEHLCCEPSLTCSQEEMTERSKSFYEWLDRRRSVRMFSNKSVPKSVIEHLILSASTAPSGANKQPWMFCAVSDKSLKARIREAAEALEKVNYESRMSNKWKEDLVKLGTDFHKPFLEDAPWLIIVFRKTFDFDENGNKQNNYYVSESVGIACGMLITAIHNAGLVTLPYTPSPMNFLSEILDRPSNEKAYIVFPVGHPAEKAFIPNIHRKKLDEICKFYE